MNDKYKKDKKLFQKIAHYNRNTHGIDGQLDTSREITVVVDTREGTPLFFGKHVHCVRAPLDSGDYSALGYEGRVVIERKSHADAWASVLKNRDRFKREWERMSQIIALGGRAYVLIECSRDQFETPPHKNSQANPKAVINTYAYWSRVYSVDVVFCAGRREAAKWALETLRAAVEYFEYGENDETTEDSAGGASGGCAAYFGGLD